MVRSPSSKTRRATWWPSSQTISTCGEKSRKFVIFGSHVIVYSKDATADRAFFRDVLGFSSVDAGHDWLIFALPPAEVAVHPAEENAGHELYFICDDLSSEIAALREKDVRCAEVEE